MWITKDVTGGGCVASPAGDFCRIERKKGQKKGPEEAWTALGQYRVLRDTDQRAERAPRTANARTKTTIQSADGICSVNALP